VCLKSTTLLSVVLFTSFLPICIYVLLGQENGQISNDLMQEKLNHANTEDVSANTETVFI